MGSRAVRCRMLFIASAPSIMVICRPAAGAWAVAVGQIKLAAARTAEQQRTTRAVRDANSIWILHPRPAWAFHFCAFLILATLDLIVTDSFIGCRSPSLVPGCTLTFKERLGI